MYKKVATDMNFVDREKSVETFWEENDIFQKSIDNRKEGPEEYGQARRLPGIYVL